MVLSRRVWLILVLSAFGPFVPTPPGAPGDVVRCSGRADAPRDVQVRVGRIRLAAPAVPREVRDLLKVSVRCLDASYDPVTDQARWSYEVELKNTDRTNRYAFHLTHLERRVANGLERLSREDKVVNLQNFTLDVLRADLHVGAGQGLSFPCAESLGAARLSTVRLGAGYYTVLRTYAGDVTVTGPDGKAQFIPVEIAFEVDFALPKLTGALADEPAREKAPRRLEWARISDKCETCRPLIMCESLARTRRLQPAPAPPADPPSYKVSETPQVHVVAGLERRPVIVDPTLAERKRTVACTRWSPLENARLDARCWTTETAGRVLADGSGLVQTDGTEHGLAAATPYLTFHHAVPVKCLSTGTWQVELLLGEVLDNWKAFRLFRERPEDAWKADQEKLVEACLLDQNPWKGKFELR
jgi:hypothetical protein